ncbi:glycosyltransferase [Actinoplanes sp. NPDC024001]|uniref:glycosyltransferase n=1 Tax=Actinoplanes sp. NPDC024001 TaxID=3154598 RepID=UPI0033BFF20E
MTGDITVLIPATPAAAWLDQAIESLLVQSYPAWNLIVVLDGDCDHNRAVLERQELRGRVKIKVLPARSGVVKALNAGLAEASTDLVARLDADDVCEPERFETQIQALTERPDLLLIGSGATVIDQHGRTIGAKPAPVGPDRIRRRLAWHNIIVHSSVIYRRQAVLDVGGYHPACRIGQDYQLWLRLAKIGPLDNIAAPLVRYRVHDGQHSRPLVDPTVTAPIRAARRRLSTVPLLGPAYADLRHLTWLSYQHLQDRRRRTALAA